jgi:hypothetical protein
VSPELIQQPAVDDVVEPVKLTREALRAAIEAMPDNEATRDARAVVLALLPVLDGSMDPPDELEVELPQRGSTLIFKKAGGPPRSLKLSLAQMRPVPTPRCRRERRRESRPRVVRRTRAGTSRDGPSDSDPDDLDHTGPEPGDAGSFGVPEGGPRQ